MKYREAVKLSWWVRKCCQDFAFSEKAKEYDFYRDRNLACMCAVASMALRKASGDKFKVIKGRYYFKKRGEPHCWVEWEDWIFDITATQFGVAIPVYVLRIENGGQYTEREEVKGYRDIRWGMTQDPSPRLTKLILGVIK